MSTGTTVGFDVRPAANSEKSVDEQGGFRDLNPSFDGLTTFDFASRVAGGEMTEDADDSEAVMQDPDEYIRNLGSLGGAAFNNSTVLAGSTGAFDRPNLRNRQALFLPKKYNSPSFVKHEHKVRKHATSDSIISLLLISPGEICVAYCVVKIGYSNLQACVAPILPGQTTCGVGSHVTNLWAFTRKTCTFGHQQFVITLQFIFHLRCWYPPFSQRSSRLFFASSVLSPIVLLCYLVFPFFLSRIFRCYLTLLTLLL